MLWVRWTEVGPCSQHQSKVDALVQRFESSSTRSLADQEVYLFFVSEGLSCRGSEGI